jgi:hypothetical protein
MAKVEKRVVHVLPVNDSIEHVEAGFNCPCAPRVEWHANACIVVHDAADGRPNDATVGQSDDC